MIKFIRLYSYFIGEEKYHVHPIENVQRRELYTKFEDFIMPECSVRILYFSQKQLPREMESRLVIIECAGYIFWQLFLRLL